MHVIYLPYYMYFNYTMYKIIYINICQCISHGFHSEHFSLKYKYNLYYCIYLNYICETCEVLSADTYITTT